MWILRTSYGKSEQNLKNPKRSLLWNDVMSKHKQNQVGLSYCEV